MTERPDIAALYRSYGHSVLRRARQILGNEDEAREVLQEIFVALVARPGQFDGRSAPSTFLYTVTTHACLTRVRKQRNRARLLAHQVTPWLSDVAPGSPEAIAAVRAVLARLPDEQARAVTYYYMDGMTHAEIADVLSCSRRHVGDLLERAVETTRAKEAS